LGGGGVLWVFALCSAWAAATQPAALRSAAQALEAPEEAEAPPPPPEEPRFSTPPPDVGDDGEEEARKIFGDSDGENDDV